MRQSQPGYVWILFILGVVWQNAFCAVEEESFFLETPVRVNGVDKGSIRVGLQGAAEGVLLDVSDLTKLVERFVSEEGKQKCGEALPSNGMVLSPFEGKEGFSAQFCEGEQVVEVKIPISWIRLETISLTKPEREEPKDIISPSPWSGQANFYFEKTFNYLTNSCWNQKYRLGKKSKR